MSKICLYSLSILLGLFVIAPDRASALKSRCLDCHTKELKAAFTARYQHPAFAKLQCDVCHKPHKNLNTLILTFEGNELCTLCHPTNEAPFKTAHQKMPVDKIACLSCHSPHGSPYKGVLRKSAHMNKRKVTCESCHKKYSGSGKVALKMSMPQLCLQCHEMNLANPFAHSPVANGDCTECHDPHASKSPNSIIDLPEKTILCDKCHDNQATNIYMHQPVAEGKCSICHAAHVGRRRYRLTAYENEICFSCHRTPPESHKIYPINLTPKTSTIPDFFPLGDGQKVLCYTCHDPHGSGQEAFLRKPREGLCISCHPRKDVEIPELPEDYPEDDDFIDEDDGFDDEPPKLDLIEDDFRY